MSAPKISYMNYEIASDSQLNRQYITFTVFTLGKEWFRIIIHLPRT